MTDFAFWLTFLIQVTVSLIIALIICIPLVIFLYWIHIKQIKKGITEEDIAKAQLEKSNMKGGVIYAQKISEEQSHEGRYETIREQIRNEIRGSGNARIGGESGNQQPKPLFQRSGSNNNQRLGLPSERFIIEKTDSGNNDENNGGVKNPKRSWKKL